MYPIRTATPADLDQVVPVLVRLQADPAHHIAYHGVTTGEITEELTAFRPDWSSGAVVATDSHARIRGVLSVDADPELGRAWLHGPFVDIPSHHPAAGKFWQATADALLDRALLLPRLSGIKDLELCGHRLHRQLADFAARHDFPERKPSRVFMAMGAPLRTVLVHGADTPSTVDHRVVALPDDARVRDAVAALHERCFPNSSVSGRQLVERRRGHTVVVSLADGLAGYAAGYAQSDEFYVDLVAVDPERRSRGIGASLVRGLLRELAARDGVRGQAAAVIGLGNDASERLFTKLGFALQLEIVGYRKVC